MFAKNDVTTRILFKYSRDDGANNFIHFKNDCFLNNTKIYEKENSYILKSRRRRPLAFLYLSSIPISYRVLIEKLTRLKMRLSKHNTYTHGNVSSTLSPQAAQIKYYRSELHFICME